MENLVLTSVINRSLEIALLMKQSECPYLPALNFTHQLS